MKKFNIKTAISIYSTFEEWMNEIVIEDDDVILTNKVVSESLLLKRNTAKVLVLEDFGSGEPNDKMLSNLINSFEPSSKRIIGIGGGSVLDCAKMLSINLEPPLEDIFQKRAQIKKERDLILLPTTCGTGSEVTNIAIMEFTGSKTKIGLVDDCIYADEAVLIPALLNTLPHSAFSYSSIDALIHAVESFLSPNGNEFSELFSAAAIEKIVTTFKEIVISQKRRTEKQQKNLLIASTLAGLAFNYAGTATIHAMSCPLSGKYHVAHGEANYSMMFAVLEYYDQHDNGEKLGKLKKILSQNLQCSREDVFKELDVLLNVLIERKAIDYYGFTLDDLEDFVQIIIQKQERLIMNSYLALEHDDYKRIYNNCLEREEV